jgi:acyl dehydratase
METFTSVEQLRRTRGKAIGPGSWARVGQPRVDAFAETTGDHQWVHVDRERAAAGPFGQTIAHGYLTLALIPALAEELFTIETGGALLNYGINKVRFPSPVPAEAEVRLTARIVEVEDHSAGSLITIGYVIEISGDDRPGLVAETLTLVVST